MKIFKKLLLPLLLSGCSVITTAGTSTDTSTNITTDKKNSAIIFDTAVSITGCTISFASKNSITTHTPNFKKGGECRLVSFDRTNILNIQFINGRYIAFIENNINNLDGCTSEYTAIAIGKDGSLFSSDLVKRSGSCHQGKEPKAFQYYSLKLKAI